VRSFGPPTRVSTCSDVMRARCGDRRCPGDSKPGLTAVARSRESERAQPASSTHALPTDAASRVPQGMASVALLAASIPGHRSTFGCIPDGDEGATRRVALHRGAPLCTKAGRGTRDPTGDIRRSVIPRGISIAREDSRVRECDLITCCVASPPRLPSDRHRPSGAPMAARASEWLWNSRVHAAPKPERRRDAKGEGIPGRGSSVSFTRCEVSRSWLDGCARSLHRQREQSEERQGCQTWLAPLDDSAGRQRPFRASAETTEARNGVVKRRPHRCSPARVRARGNRADQGARLIRGIGQKSVVRIFGSSISLASKDVRGATGGSSDESSHAPCDTDAYRYPQDVGLRFAARWIELRRGGVANGCAIRETVVSKPLPLGSGERASACRTTRRNASRSCSLAPNPRPRVGARFSQVGLAGYRRKPMLGAGSCRLAIGPEEGGACENDDGRERSDSTERGSSSQMARGVGTGAKSSTGRERSSNTFPGTVPRYARSAEAGALYGASPDTRSWSANSLDPYAATHRTTVLPHHVPV